MTVGVWGMSQSQMLPSEAKSLALNDCPNLKPWLRAPPPTFRGVLQYTVKNQLSFLSVYAMTRSGFHVQHMAGNKPWSHSLLLSVSWVFCLCTFFVVWLRWNWRATRCTHSKCVVWEVRPVSTPLHAPRSAWLTVPWHTLPSSPCSAPSLVNLFSAFSCDYLVFSKIL